MGVQAFTYGRMQTNLINRIILFTSFAELEAKNELIYGMLTLLENNDCITSSAI